MRCVSALLILIVFVVGCGTYSDNVSNGDSVQGPQISKPGEGTSYSSPEDQDGEFVSACSIGSDKIAHVSQLLEENEIDGYMLGSRSFGVMVHPDDLERAREVIRKDSEENGDYASFSHDGLLYVCMIDPSRAEHVGSLLDDHGISAIIEGSVAYGVLVAPADAARVEELIRQDSEQHGHYAAF